MSASTEAPPARQSAACRARRCSSPRWTRRTAGSGTGWTAHTAEGAVALLERGHALLRGDLAGLAGEAALDEPRRTNWGELWPAWRIFAVMTDHDALHAGAIGCLRDLHLWTARRIEP